MPKTVCLDFDGVMNNYDGWKGEYELFTPRPGISRFIQDLKESGFSIVVHSTRPANRIQKWIREWGVGEGIEVVDHKPKAICYLDDRGIRFDGNFDDALAQIKSFRTFWESDPT